MMAAVANESATPALSSALLLLHPAGLSQQPSFQRTCFSCPGFVSVFTLYLLLNAEYVLCWSPLQHASVTATNAVQDYLLHMCRVDVEA
jgi:hypothetical protein